MNRRTFIPLLGTAIVSASCLAASGSSTFTLTPGTVLPRALRRGDTIGITAPAGGARRFEEAEEFQKLLESLGYKVKIGKVCTTHHGYFSANDWDRAQDFMDLIQDDEVNAIFFLRGGWGCARLLEFLDFKVIEQNPKIIMGFSDITTLLNVITTKTGIITFHGPSGNSSWNDYSLDYVDRLLTKGEMVTYKNNPTDAPIRTYASGTATGQLFGGNLSVICGLVGSTYLPDWKEKILFLEDVGEEPYRIDRMLTQLRLAGIFKAVNGVVLGNFRKCSPEEPDRSFTLEEVFEQHFASEDIPVYYGAQIGHTRDKYTVPVGTKVKIDADQGTIELLEPGVRL